MATAIDAPISRTPPDTSLDTLSTELRLRQQSIAEITEMIHVSSLQIFAFSSGSAYNLFQHYSLT